MCCRTAFLNKLELLISENVPMINVIVLYIIRMCTNYRKYLFMYFVSHMLFIIKGKAILLSNSFVNQSILKILYIL